MIDIQIDLRNHFGPIRDQGQRPTCLAFAASDLHAARRGPWAPLSCEYLFYHAQQRARRGPYQGARLSSLLEAMREEGQPLEAAWPYLVRVPTDLTTWLPPAHGSQLFRRAGEAGADTVDAIITELGAGRPTLTLLQLSASFDHIGRDGVVDQIGSEAPNPLRRHAVIAVGHGVFGAQRAVLVRNSWGAGWGLAGYGWLTESYLRPRVFRLAHLKEDLSVSTSSAAA